MQIKKGGTTMNIDFAVVFELVKKLVLMIFEKYEVIKEFNDLGIDIVSLLGGDPTPEDGRILQ